MLRGSDVIGDYTLVRPLGAGELGETWLAVRRGVGGFARRFAVRVLQQHLWRDPAAGRALLAEARVGNALSHPNLMAIVDAAEAPQGVPYIVMEYVDGPSAADLRRIAPTTPQRERMLAGIFEPICQALSYAHGKGVTAGILIPTDVRVTLRGAPKLLGLEASYFRGQFEDSWTPAMDRQLRYAAPEMLRLQGKATPAGDVFSLAVVLWETFAGRELYGGATSVQVMQQRLAGVLPSAEGLALPDALGSCLRRALAQSPEERPSVGEIAATLRVLSGRPSAGEIADWLRVAMPAELLARFDEDAQSSDPTPLANLRASPRSPPSVPPGMRELVQVMTPRPTTRQVAPPPQRPSIHPMVLAGDPHLARVLTEKPRVPSIAPTLAPPKPAPPAEPPARARGGLLVPLLGGSLAIGAGLLCLALGIALWPAPSHERDAVALLAEARRAADDGRTRLAIELLTRVHTTDPQLLAEVTRFHAELVERARSDRASLALPSGEPPPPAAPPPVEPAPAAAAPRPAPRRSPSSPANAPEEAGEPPATAFEAAAPEPEVVAMAEPAPSAAFEAPAAEPAVSSDARPLPRPSSPRGSASGGLSLPDTVQVSTVYDLREHLRKIEEDLVQDGRSPDEVAGVTAALANQLALAVEAGQTVTLYPRAIYLFVEGALAGGMDRKTLRSELKRNFARE